MYASWVSIDIAGSTAQPKDLVCTNTIIGIQVDCTIVVTKSWTIKINATNGGAAVSWTEPDYVIKSEKYDLPEE